MAPWWLELYVFVLMAASVAWAAEVLWLVVGRAIWRRILRVARSRQRAAGGGSVHPPGPG